MFPDATILWENFPSELDGINGLNLEIVRADCGNDVSLVLSRWSGGKCLNAYSVRFGRPQIILAVDESIYCRGSPIPAPGNARSNSTGCFFRTAHSILLHSLAAVEAHSGAGVGGKLGHYLIEGLNTYVEVIGEHKPQIIRHADYAASVSYASTS